MTWNKVQLYLFCLSVTLYLQGCAIYSFTGTSLSEKVKTFSVADFQSSVADGPSDLAETLKDMLTEGLQQRISGEQVDRDGDVHFEATITGFEYQAATSSAGTSSTEDRDETTVLRLSITVQVNYTNKHDKQSNFAQKKFSQHADMPAESDKDAEGPRLVEEIFTKIVRDVFNASITSW